MLQALLLVIFALFTGRPAMAGPAPGTHAERAFKKEKKDGATAEEKDAEQAAAEAEAERQRKEILARVIVLKWEGTKSADYEDETVRRNVRSRIARPEAMFFPEVDIYQQGRKVPDRTVVPALQLAIVPDSNIPRVMAAVDSVSGIPWNALEPYEWRQKADELRAMADDLWFVDRVELREPLFLLYSQIGRAAENAADNSPPYYERVGPYSINYYYYLAATLAYQDPTLMSKITDPELNASINIQLQQIQQGSYPVLTVDFQQEGVNFDVDWFNNTYEVRLNGIVVEPDARGQLDVFLGRSDLYLKRKDTGHGLSERLEVTKLDNKIYFIRDVARKKVGKDFIDQLFLHKNECNPEVDDDILNYLAIYAKLHAKAEIYIAVAENGNPNKMWIWRYDRKAAQLKKVGGGPDSFPVRFAAVFSTGVLYNNGTVGVNDNFTDQSSLAPTDVVDDSRLALDLNPATIPFNFELRGHYNRLMVDIGAEFGYEAGGAGGWIEYYQTPGAPDTLTVDTAASNCQDVELDANNDGIPDTDSDGNTIGALGCDELYTVYNTRVINRNLWLGAGVVFLRDAGLGFGPRLSARVGFVNMPHGLQTTGHFGWAIQPGFLPAGERVRPMVDLDARGGIAIPLNKSLFMDTRGDRKLIQPVFGLTVGAGMTF